MRGISLRNGETFQVLKRTYLINYTKDFCKKSFKKNFLLILLCHAHAQEERSSSMLNIFQKFSNYLLHDRKFSMWHLNKILKYTFKFFKEKSSVEVTYRCNDFFSFVQWSWQPFSYAPHRKRRARRKFLTAKLKRIMMNVLRFR